MRRNKPVKPTPPVRNLFQPVKYEYQFVHPTKCGGTAFKDYIQKHKLPIKCTNHEPKCSGHPNPIIILRDPIERFISMYNYWKNGSERYGRGNEFQNYSIDDYIGMIKNRNKLLTKVFTWDQHYAPMSEWINPEDYSKTIVIMYKPDLGDSITALLNFINKPVPNVPMEKVNVSKKTTIILTGEQINWVKEYYACDYELLKQNFKKVI
jgi:hypothetical protein